MVGVGSTDALFSTTENSMDWLNKLLADRASAPQLVNDSKTPSGKAHVGALRGVLIHDAAFRFLRDHGIDVRYTFGCDDYDPLDELPAEHREFFEPYLGMPLCNVPPPPGSPATDLADHYITDFFGIFADLGVGATTYRLRDVYRSGRFDSAIRRILDNADTVRRVYKEVSNSVRPGSWYPFQVICEQCGRIGTTEVVDFDGSQVQYRCRRDLVSWAKGCNHEGWVSPYGGNGKLPWKLEWVAKWEVFGVTIEGGGKDHSTKGGARDVAAACLRAIFRKDPPTNIPYEFFLLAGAKMSSSRGIGASAREVSALLPPEVLRFLMLKQPPNRQVNFGTDEEHLTKLFNDFDRLRSTVYAKGGDHSTKQLFRLCMVNEEAPIPAFEPPFQLLTTLLQMPHLDVWTEIAKLKGSPLNPVEQEHATRRLRCAEYWLEHYATPEDRIVVQWSLPRSAEQLPDVERAFLQRLSVELVGMSWTESSLQGAVFDAARATPIASAQACKAIYRVFLDRASGPRAGSLLSCLEPKFVASRLVELPFSLSRFWLDTAEELEEFEVALSQDKEAVSESGLLFNLLLVALDSASFDGERSCLGAIGSVEATYSPAGARRLCRRAIFSRIKTIGCDPAGEESRFRVYAQTYAEELGRRFALALPYRIQVRFEDLRGESISGRLKDARES